MDFWEYKLLKALAILVVIGVACFVYSAVTGRDLRDRFKDHS